MVLQGLALGTVSRPCIPLLSLKSWGSTKLGPLRYSQMAAPSKPSSPVIPRPSASLIVVNTQNEVLLVHRNPKSASFAGAHVFPGGNYDPVQDDTLQMCALRETFEETGLLLASPQSLSYPTNEQLDAARENVHAHRTLFTTFLSQHHLTADTTSLMPFTQWITPPSVPRRFHTQFYVAFLNAAPSTGFSSGHKQERLPTPDGGQEVIAAQFIRPAAALEAFRARRISLMPPQVYLLVTLADILVHGTTTPAQRERVAALSAAPFGRMVITPRALPEPDAEGRMVLTYEGDQARGGVSGRTHRSLVRFGKGGIASEVILQRNFDIFCDIEDSWFTGNSKL